MVRKTQSSTKKRKFWIAGSLLLLGAAIGVWFALTNGARLAPLALPQGEMLWGRIGVEAIGPFTIGDQIPVTFEVEAKESVDCRLPDLSKSFSQNHLEVIRKYPLRSQSLPGGVRKTVRYVVVSWQAGRFTLPAVKLRYTYQNAKRIYTITGQTLEVVSVLPPRKSAEQLKALAIKGVKQPLSLPPRYLVLGCYLLASLLVSAFFWSLRTLKKHQETAPVEPELPPEPADVIALRRLEIIKSSNYIGEKKFLVFYTELSECIREYMENRYRINALEMTTEEFLQHLTGDSRLPETEQQVLKEFLSSADLVKFAKYIPAETEANQALAAIEQLILATREEIVAEPASDDVVAIEAPPTN